MKSAFSGRRVLRHDVLPWLLVITVALLPRLLALDADPPRDLGSAFFTDEGWWSHNARQYALFGEWVLDDQNLPLYSTPAYTIALAGVYKLLGVGFFQTRLVSALSGALTCMLLYGFLRSRNRKLALAAALMLGCSYPVLLHNRIGLTESFQVLFLVLTAIAVMQSVRRPAWGMAAGVFLVLAMLAKASSVIMVMTLPVFWAIHWYCCRRGFQLRFSWRPVLYCIAGGAVSGLIVFLAVIWPHWQELRSHMVSPLLSSMGALESDRISLFGLPIGLAVNEFFIASAVLLVAVALLAVNRLGEGPGKVDEVELFCWVWLVVGFLFLSAITYQPFRRFLILSPPLVILAGIALTTGGLRIPGAETWKRRAKRYRIVAAAICGSVVAYYLARGLAPLASALTSGVSLGGEKGISTTVLRLLLWHFVFATILILGYVGSRRLPARGIAIPSLVFVLAFVVAEPARFVYHTFPVHYDIRNASREIAVYARLHGLHGTAIVGNTADTFAMETDLFAFTIRSWKERQSYMNLDGLTRFRPSLAIELRRQERHSLKEIEETQDRYRLTGRYEIWRHRRKSADIQVGLFRIVETNPKVFHKRRPPAVLEGGPPNAVVD